jgi:hypothetical protein
MQKIREETYAFTVHSHFLIERRGIR